jgi:hypothetical protein
LCLCLLSFVFCLPCVPCVPCPLRNAISDKIGVGTAWAWVWYGRCESASGAATEASWSYVLWLLCYQGCLFLSILPCNVFLFARIRTYTYTDRGTFLSSSFFLFLYLSYLVSFSISCFYPLLCPLTASYPLFPSFLASLRSVSLFLFQTGTLKSAHLPLCGRVCSYSYDCCSFSVAFCRFAGPVTFRRPFSSLFLSFFRPLRRGSSLAGLGAWVWPGWRTEVDNLGLLLLD